VTWITGCMKFAFKTGASSASEGVHDEDRPDRYRPIATPNITVAWKPPILKR